MAMFVFYQSVRVQDMLLSISEYYIIEYYTFM